MFNLGQIDIIEVPIRLVTANHDVDSKKVNENVYLLVYCLDIDILQIRVLLSLCLGCYNKPKNKHDNCCQKRIKPLFF